MAFAASLILIAVGTALWSASDVEAAAVSAAATALFVAGAVGLSLSLLFWSSFGTWGPWRTRR